MHSQFTKFGFPFEGSAEALIPFSFCCIIICNHFLVLSVCRFLPCCDTDRASGPQRVIGLSQRRTPSQRSYIPGHTIRKGGEIPMKTRKKKVLSEHAKRQEASFWKMMKAADSGRQCFS